jgi:hypothetical protein
MGELIPKCRFCDREAPLQIGCTKRRAVVCRDHQMIVCPQCGYEAFYMTGLRAPDRYVCFRMTPWCCDWVSDGPPGVAS